MDTKKKFGAWLTQKYIEWQTKAGRKSVSDLADYLDISQSMTSRYMNGKSVPEGENLIKVAIRFGDEVYEVLGVKPPNKDPRLLQINSYWDDLGLIISGL